MRVPQDISNHQPTPTFECGLCHKDKHAGEIDFYSGRVKALGLPEITGLPVAGVAP